MIDLSIKKISSFILKFVCSAHAMPRRAKKGIPLLTSFPGNRKYAFFFKCYSLCWKIFIPFPLKINRSEDSSKRNVKFNQPELFITLEHAESILDLSNAIESSPDLAFMDRMDTLFFNRFASTQFFGIFKKKNLKYWILDIWTITFTFFRISEEIVEYQNGIVLKRSKRPH